MKTKLTLLIAVLIIVSLTFLGCKAQLEERIAELEGKLAEEENRVVQVEEEEAPPVMLTETKQMEEETTEEDEPEEKEEAAEEADVDKEAPTISLEIYEGPVPVESICYYRVQANVTGNPRPTVTFSKDDSGGTWGTKKAQVNLNDPTDTYTLIATATNSEGSATATIDLSWGCPIPEPEPIEEDVNISADVSLSGSIRVDWGADPGENPVWVGDTSFNDKPIKAYLSFDINNLGNLDDIIIKDVSVSIPLNSIVGNPEMVGGSEVDIKVCYYGDSLELADQNLSAVGVKTINATDSLTNFNFSSNKLEDELQKAVDTDRKWFQLKIETSGVLSNGVWDYYEFYTSDTVLHIKYEVP